MLGNVLRNITKFFSQPIASSPEMNQLRPVPPSSAPIERCEKIPYHVLAEMQVAFDNLIRSVNAGERGTLVRMHDLFQGLTSGLGFNRNSAIAYDESNDRTRIAPHKIDLTRFEGEAVERTKSLANLGALLCELEKLDNFEANGVARELRSLLQKLNEDRERFDRDCLANYGRPRPLIQPRNSN